MWPVRRPTSNSFALWRSANTSNASDDFNAKDELKRSKQERDAHTGDERLRDDGVELTDKHDHQMIRGENQESVHHTPREDG